MRFHFGDLPSSEEKALDLEGWHRIHSPSLRLGYLLAGLVGFLFPNLLCAWLIIVSLLAAQSEGTEAPVDAATPDEAVSTAVRAAAERVRPPGGGAGRGSGPAAR